MQSVVKCASQTAKDEADKKHLTVSVNKMKIAAKPLGQGLHETRPLLHRYHIANDDLTTTVTTLGMNNANSQKMGEPKLVGRALVSPHKRTSQGQKLPD